MRSYPVGRKVSPELCGSYVRVRYQVTAHLLARRWHVGWPHATRTVTPCASPPLLSTTSCCSNARPFPLPRWIPKSDPSHRIPLTSLRSPAWWPVLRCGSVAGFELSTEGRKPFKHASAAQPLNAGVPYAAACDKGRRPSAGKNRRHLMAAVNSNAKLGDRQVQSGDIGDSCPGTWVTLSRSPLRATAMPWPETAPMFERLHFFQDLASGQWTMTELCTRYGISRNTG